MQRDIELVRSLLLAVEASVRASEAQLLSVVGDDDLAKASFEQLEDAAEKLECHLSMLTEEAKFLTGICVSTYGGKHWVDLELTWQGHEFLDAVRDPEVWGRAKDGAEAAGNWTIGFLAESAKAHRRGRRPSG